MDFRIFLALLISSVLLIQGCSPGSVVKSRSPETTHTDPDNGRAKALSDQGQFAAAAELYQTIADRNAPPARQEYLLLAAEAWMSAGNPAASKEVFDQIGTAQLGEHLRLRQNLLGAEIAISQSRGNEALSRLGEAPGQGTSLSEQRRYYQDKARALEFTGNALESARALSQLDALLSEHDERLQNQQAILQTLGTLSDQVLELFQDPNGDAFSGWMQLTRISRNSAAVGGDISALLEQWRQRYSGHPAMPELLQDFAQQVQARHIDVTSMAVFLPESGPFANAASALRDGLMTAYYSQPEMERPELRFYDSSNTEAIWPLYQQAVADGASIVIGPLVKQAVSQLAHAGALPVAVLALNQVQLDVAAPANFYQFGLSPEDEARQIAERAWSDNHATAVIFTPEGSWGDRVASSFRSRWEALGGTVAAQQSYKEDQNDFGGPIRQLMNLEQSQARYRDILALLGGKVEFEPHRRQDVDFIVLAAQPDKARQIWPAFQFYRAGDLPIYATSHSYSGTLDERADIDLNGLTFADSPWILGENSGDRSLSRNTLASQFPSAGGRDARLFAMGMDAYRLAPQLYRLASSPTEMLDGATGRLYIGDNHEIRRQLLWARFRNARPEIIGYAPRLDSVRDQYDSATMPAGLGAAPAPAY